MRKQLAPAALALLVLAGLAGCSPNGNGTAPSPSPTTAGPTTPGTPDPGAGTPSPDTETTAPAPSPSAAPLPSGPGEGNAELAIIVKSSTTGTAASYTLACRDGVPAAESVHPDAATACAALKNNPAILTPAPRAADQACTQQYGGPQEATVTGVVDGSAVEADFSRRDGCEIAAWDAAKDVLGPSGGAG